MYSYQVIYSVRYIIRWIWGTNIYSAKFKKAKYNPPDVSKFYNNDTNRKWRGPFYSLKIKGEGESRISSGTFF